MIPAWAVAAKAAMDRAPLMRVITSTRLGPALWEMRPQVGPARVMHSAAVETTRPICHSGMVSSRDSGAISGAIAVSEVYIRNTVSAMTPTCRFGAAGNTWMGLSTGSGPRSSGIGGGEVLIGVVFFGGRAATAGSPLRVRG